MKKLLLIFLIFLSTVSLSETYVCSQELSRHGSPGEIETVTFERIESSFNVNSKFDTEISFESKSNLILTKTFESSALYLVFIDKDTKEWGATYINMDEFRKHPSSAFSYGKCIVVK